MLVSSGAQELARLSNLTTEPSTLVSPRAQREWSKWKEELSRARAGASGAVLSSFAPASERIEGLHDIQDTVGAIALDAMGDLAAGVSR